MNCLSLGFCFFIQWMNVNMKINITFESNNNNNHPIQIIIMMLPFFCFVLSSYISLFGQSVNVWFPLGMNKKMNNDLLLRLILLLVKW